MTRHPLIPPAYLARFADEAGQVLVEARDRSRRLLASPEDAADRAGTFVVPGGGAALETLLGQAEAQGVAVIERICAGAFPARGEDRAHAAFLVALLLLRGRQHQVGVAALADHLGQVLAPRASGGTEAAVPPAATPRPRPEPVRLGLSALPALARLLSARTWQLVAFPRPALITGDTPAVLWTRAQALMPFGIRLGVADEVRVPLSPRHALILARHAPAGEVVRELGDRHAAALNRTVAEAAHEWMYYHPASDPLEGVELAPRGELT